MGLYLNSRVPFALFNAAASGKYFVDKSELLQELLPAVGTEERFFCITRPRRFGKSVMASMVASFFGNAWDSGDRFKDLQIAGFDGYESYLNQYDVIYIDFSRVPRDCVSYAQYIGRIQDGINRDLMEAYPDLMLSLSGAVWDNLQIVFEKYWKKFIFVIDEWDALFHMDFVRTEDKKSYLLFLQALLKGQAYADLAYMTGILPIAKYASGSEINGFMEFTMAHSERFGRCFGFLETEVDALYERYLQLEKSPKIAREELANWYDGYVMATGDRMYNPRSVVCALTNNRLGNYWTGSGPYEEIFYYIQHNVEDVRDDLALMISGEGVESRVLEYAATAETLRTKEQIYSAMVVYGLLTYREDEGKVFIPNKELMDKFDELLLSNEGLGYVGNLARKSEEMLKATLAGNVQKMAEILKFAHDTESPIFSYNSEIELSAIVNLVYLAARDRYRVEREDKAGEGYVDFIFYPQRKGADGLILELKVDVSPEEAIEQIKKKNYLLRFLGKMGERPKYTGRILAAGISYSRRTKEHFCRVEVLRGAV